MPRIKNWKNIIRNRTWYNPVIGWWLKIYRNEYGYVVAVSKPGNIFTGLPGNPFDTKKEAYEYAIEWMKKHPKGDDRDAIN